jgi:hypothetical protein
VKAAYYAAIMAIGERLKVRGDSADTVRRKAMATQEAGILWAAHNLAPDLPPKPK